MDVTREITREEAIANLNMISVAFVEPVTKEQRKLIDDTFEMAIKALEQEPCEDIKEFYKDIWDCDINHPRYGDTVADIVEKSYMSGYVHGVENTAKEFRFELEREPCIKEKQANADKIDAVYIDGFKAGYSQAIFDLEQEPCEDCCNGNQIEKAKLCQKSYLAGMEHKQEPKIGHWINDECGNVICSECKRFRRDCRYGHTNYCNHCGAKMVEPQERSE